MRRSQSTQRLGIAGCNSWRRPSFPQDFRLKSMRHCDLSSLKPRHFSSITNNASRSGRTGRFCSNSARISQNRWILTRFHPTSPPGNNGSQSKVRREVYPDRHRLLSPAADMIHNAATNGTFFIPYPRAKRHIDYRARYKIVRDSHLEDHWPRRKSANFGTLWPEIPSEAIREVGVFPASHWIAAGWAPTVWANPVSKNSGRAYGTGCDPWSACSGSAGFQLVSVYSVLSQSVNRWTAQNDNSDGNR